MFLSLLCICTVLFGCGASAKSESEAVPKQTLKQCASYTSCLTGLDFKNGEGRNLRPTAVAVDNVRAALPQRGLSSAQVVYEVLQSGGVTRLLAVYDDYALMPETGPVTQMSLQLMQLALPLDALCLSTSITSDADALVKQYARDNMYINGSFETSALALDSDRNASTDISRCWFTTGTLMSMAVEQYEIEQHTDTNTRKSAFNFVESGERLLDEDAKRVQIRFSGYTNTVLSYSTVRDKYSKYQFDSSQIDENSNSILSFDNVLVLFGDIISGENAESFDFSSGGAGYYFYRGKYEPITWSKSSDNAPLLFENKDGIALINKGTTYVALVDKSKSAHFQILA